MANIPKVNGTFELEVTNATQSYEDTLYTDNKNISGNIHIHITARTGTAGSPVANKTIVTEAGIKVAYITSKVTNVEGYITGGTITGTSVSVVASELVSGTKLITANGIEPCGGYESVDIQVPEPAGQTLITQQENNDVTNYASANVVSATYGATLIQGAVSNHQIVITPSVNVSQEGWAGSGKTGPSIIVKASDLVNGTITITSQNGTDVTNYASADVKSGVFNSPTTSSTLSTIFQFVTPSTVRQYVEHINGWNNDGLIFIYPATLQSKTVTPTTATQTITADGDNYGLSQVVVNAIQVETKTVTPTTATQTITPTSGKYLSSVKVNPIPSDYIIPSGILEITSGGIKDCRTYSSVSVPYAQGIYTYTGKTAGYSSTWILGTVYPETGPSYRYVRPNTYGWWRDADSLFKIPPLCIDYWGRSNGTSSGSYSVKLLKGDACVVCNDSTSVFWSTTSSVGTANKFNLSGGGYIYYSSGNWRYMNYNADSGTIISAGDSEGTLYLRTNSGKYLRRITKTTM